MNGVMGLDGDVGRKGGIQGFSISSFSDAKGVMGVGS